MEWDVFCYNINKGKIEKFNIFDHWKFNEDGQKSLKKFKDKNEFKKVIESDLMYYFWSKSQYELVIEITENNFEITSAELRDFCKSAGVHIYSERDAVIYANKSFVFIHTGEDGEQRLSVPKDAPLYDVFSSKSFETSFEAPLGKSYLLKINTKFT